MMEPRPLLEHLAAEDLVGAEGAVQVDIDDAVPIFVGEVLGAGSFLEGAGGDHQDIDLAVGEHGFVAEALQAFAILYVAREAESAGAESLRVRRRRHPPWPGRGCSRW